MKKTRKPVEMHVLVDTSIWLDLAKDYRLLPVLDALKHMQDSGQVMIVIPDLVEDEFARNKGRVIEDTKRGLASHFKRVREAVAQYAENDQQRASTLKQLNELDHRIVMKGEAAAEAATKIEVLMASGVKVKASEAAMLKAAQRGLSRRAPFHLSKNSMADAVLIEIYTELCAAKGPKDKMVFVTSNHRDFSERNGDTRKPHADIASLFAAPNSFYLTSMVDVVKAFDDHLIDEIEFEREYQQEPRRLSEILEAENLLFRQVWYNRHWNLRSRVEDGATRIITREEFAKLEGYHPEVVVDDVWKGALAAAKRTEEELGVEQLGPWDDFEWGMINGKLSALRWVLGDEWDMLDT